MDAKTASELRAQFPENQIGKLPRTTCKACSERRRACDQHKWVNNCRQCKGNHSSATIHLDYVGHADVTSRLLAVDPEWSWEPVAVDDRGLPCLDNLGNLWIRLTVAGVTRLGVGDGKSMKECIGDAIRNAAMRFGVALDLWAKGDRDFGYVGGHDGKPKDPNPVRLSGVELALADLGDLCQERGLDPVMVANDYAEGHRKTLRASTEAEVRSYISLVRSGMPEEQPPSTGLRAVSKSEQDKARNPEHPDVEKAARLEQNALVRDVLGVDAKGRKRADVPAAERLDKVPDDDPFYTEKTS